MNIYLLGLIIAAGLGFIPANLAKNKGHNFWLWWFYGWMLFIVAIIHVNFIPDKNSPAVPQNLSTTATNIPPVTHTSSINSVADEIKKYKELLDSGIITEEEFQAKKKQLLNL